jgi:hypothetical protein
MELLKEIVESVFLEKMSSKSRTRNAVDARMVYGKILRDLGYGHRVIGESINRNHACIVHYMKNIDFILKQDKQLKAKYEYCKRKYILSSNNLPNVGRTSDAFITIIRLEQELDETKDKINNTLHKFVDGIENYIKENHRFPSIKDCRESILPLFEIQ